jgi:hypothetical protein
LENVTPGLRLKVYTEWSDDAVQLDASPGRNWTVPCFQSADSFAVTSV